MTKSKKTAAKSSKKKSKLLAELPSQPDPRAPLDLKLLLRAAAPVLRRAEADLRERVEASDSVRARLEAEHKRLCDARRCGEEYSEWLNAFVEQVAAAWLLACVFVRTLEDRGLLDHNRLAGPGAADSLQEFLQLAPSLSERDYIQLCLRELLHLPAADALFGQRENPIWLLAPSAEGARELLELFRTPNPEAPALRFGQADTRFLGDLYQDLNENVRARYALLQTPDFVVDYMLDRTLEPAIERFGLEHADLIDPTCGSGHFLLAAFDRLFDRFQRAAPNDLAGAIAERALAKVFGTDINPYAVVISRFRLTLAFLEKCGIERLKKAPKLTLNVVVADSLLYNERVAKLESKPPGAANGRHFALEHAREADALLNRKAKFAAVIGNPPYITVKDSALRELYRGTYEKSAAGTYSMGAPFTQRFFELARSEGRVGMITSNSFMKREFGKKLITAFLRYVNLESVVDTAGAYLPGHGTPTVLLFGSHQLPRGQTVRAVLGKRGEPSTPNDPSQGLVWSAIRDHGDKVGYDNDYISVAALNREKLEQHPWSLSGGGALELKVLLESRATRTLREVADIGGGDRCSADEIFTTPRGSWQRYGMSAGAVRALVVGEELRDWHHACSLEVYFPYDARFNLVEPQGRDLQLLWPYRTSLQARAVFGGGTYKSAGRPWWEWHQVTKERNRIPLTIALAEVATHNHFVLDRGGKVFKQTASIIKLRDGSTEDEYLALLAYLNSSTVCFYLRQVCHQKQMVGADSVRHTDPTTVTFAFNASAVATLPVVDRRHFPRLVALAQRMEEQLDAMTKCEIGRLISENLTNSALPRLLERSAVERESLRLRMVGIQESLDWLVYSSFGLCAETLVGDSAPCRPGGRAFEVRLRDRGVTATIDGYAIPDPDTASVADPLIQARMKAVLENPQIALLEQPQFKRRWIGRQGKFNHGAVDDNEQIARAIRDRISELIERWFKSSTQAVSPKHIGSGTLLDRHQGLEALMLAREVDQAVGIASALASEAVPYLSAWTFSETGRPLHAEWNRVWELQRRQDAGKGVPHIPVPPKYEPKDFRKPEYWRLRGKLDVPKERFISYPGLESDEDGEPIYGWAGWDHAQRARALLEVYQNRKQDEGWTAERLTPALAGLHELLPWVKQWHNEPDPQYDGARFGDDLDAFLAEELRHHGLTEADLLAWRPDSKPRARKDKAATDKKSKPPKLQRQSKASTPANDNIRKRNKEAV